MKITVDFLKSIGACSNAIEEFEKHGDCELIDLLQEMIKKKYRLSWANWLIARCMNYKQYVSYGVYGAESVIKIYEKEYPENKRPRKAIQAAKRCLINPSNKNKNAANAAAVDIRIKILEYGIKLLEKETNDENE